VSPLFSFIIIYSTPWPLKCIFPCLKFTQTSPAACCSIHKSFFLWIMQRIFFFFAMRHLWNVIFLFIVFHVQYALKIPLSWNFIGRKLTSVCWFSRTPQEKKGLGCVWAYGWSLIKWGSRCPWSAGREECSIYDLTVSAGSICIDCQENWEPSSTR